MPATKYPIIGESEMPKKEKPASGGAGGMGGMDY
jgi:hypothetical protein